MCYCEGLWIVPPYFGIQGVFEQWKCLGHGKDILTNSKKAFLSCSMDVIEFCAHPFSCFPLCSNSVFFSDSFLPRHFYKKVEHAWYILEMRYEIMHMKLLCRSRGVTQNFWIIVEMPLSHTLKFENIWLPPQVFSTSRGEWVRCTVLEPNHSLVPHEKLWQKAKEI